MSDGSTHYLDPKTSAVAQSYVALSRGNRWLYHGLHSFDRPVLYRNRPLWDVVVMGLMIGGTTLRLTGVSDWGAAAAAQVGGSPWAGADAGIRTARRGRVGR